MSLTLKRKKEMITFRLTKSLAKKLNLKLKDSLYQSTSKFGDWYATDFRLGHRQFILCTSEKGRFPIVVEAAPYKNFHERLVYSLKLALTSLGVSQAQIETELMQFNEYQYAKTSDRSVTGTMVDSIKQLEAFYSYKAMNLDNCQVMSEYLSKVPHLALKSFPDQMTLELFQKPLLS